MISRIRIFSILISWVLLTLLTSCSLSGIFNKDTQENNWTSVFMSRAPEVPSFFWEILLVDSGSRDYKLTGKLTGKFKQISVTYSFSGSSEEPYVIAKYDSGSMRFEYNISPGLGNLGIGKNSYTFVGIHDNGARESKIYEFINQRSVFRYPGCSVNDEIIGYKIWASCNVWAISPEDSGSQFMWWNNTPLSQKELTTIYTKRTSIPGNWSPGNTWPCQKGYHVPTTEEWAEFYYRAGQIPDSNFAERFLNYPNKMGDVKRFWSSTEWIGTDDKGYRYMADVNSADGREYWAAENKVDVFPVRCILDKETEALNVISDPFTKSALISYQDFKKKRNSSGQSLMQNQVYESPSWKVSVQWDGKYIHPKTLTIENKKINEKNSQEIEYDTKWREEMLAKYSIKCSKQELCSDADAEKDLESNSDMADFFSNNLNFLGIFNDEYLTIQYSWYEWPGKSVLYKIPESWPIAISDSTKADFSFTGALSQWFISDGVTQNSPQLLVGLNSGYDGGLPCAYLFHKEDIEKGWLSMRCEFFTLGNIEQFSYKGKYIIFVHATNIWIDDGNSKNLEEYIKQNGQYLPPEAKVFHWEWPTKNTFYIYDLVTGKFEKKTEFPWEFN